MNIVNTSNERRNRRVRRFLPFKAFRDQLSFDESVFFFASFF